MPARLERLLPHEASERWAQAPIAYWPIGPLEFHGAHLPFGLDPLTAQGVCLRAAELTGGLVLPPFWFGTGGEHGDYPFTLMTTPEAMRPLLADTVRSLFRWKARVIVLFTGHLALEQRQLLDQIAAEYSRGAHGTVLSLSALDWTENPHPPDHAGRFETTLLASTHPELVQVTRLPQTPLPAEASPYGHQRHDPRHPLFGIFGADPRGYQPEEASGLREGLAHWLAARVRSVPLSP